MEVVHEPCRRGIDGLHRPELPPADVTQIGTRRAYGVLTRLDTTTVPVRHPATPAHHVGPEQGAVHDIGRQRRDAATQFADTTEGALAAQRADVEAVSPDPSLVPEARRRTTWRR